ncbi:MAG: histidinol-phosphate transaminase [Myxococcales bacterium]
MRELPLVVSPNIERLSPYVPGKPLEQLERELGIRDAVKLASNESPLGPSPRAVEAAARTLGQAHRYPDGTRLREALAAHHGVLPSEVILGNGSNELIDLVCRTFAGSVRHAVYPDPSFVCYRSGTLACNIATSEVPLREHVHYDADAIVQALRPETGLVFLANPNNPTGAYLTRSELERILEAAPANALVVLDEAYVEFVDAPDFVSGTELRGRHPNLIVLRTFSKAYGLAALRVGYGLARAKVVDYLDRVRAPFNVSAAGLAAAQAALEDREHVARYVELNRGERERVRQGLTRLGLKPAPSQANFVLVDMGRSGREMYEALLREGVIVRPMGPPIGSFLRISIGLPAENDRMLASLERLLHGVP